MSNVLNLARPQLRDRVGYVAASPARDSIRLHANEAPWSMAAAAGISELNRYPPPVSAELAAKLASFYGVSVQQLLVTRGSDEGIDILLRTFCEASRDSIVICPPTFGMYRQFAEIQGARITSVPLLADKGFELDRDGVLNACQPGTKLVFVCSPNNPTGNTVATDTIRTLCSELNDRALVVVDEAYIEFAGRPGMAALLDSYPNLVVLRTLSKAFGLAGARCGSLLAGADITALLRTVMPPYVLPSPVLDLLQSALTPARLASLHERVAALVAERDRVAAVLRASDQVIKVWPSSANFLLVRFADCDAVMQRCVRSRVLLRDFSPVPGLDGCLRITIGSPDDNASFLRALDGEKVPA